MRCRWHGSEQPLNVYLIDFRPRIEAQLHIHTSIKVFPQQCLHNSTWRLVKNNLSEAALDQRRGKCFNMFCVRAYFMTSWSVNFVIAKFLSFPDIFFFLKCRYCSIQISCLSCRVGNHANILLLHQNISHAANKITHFCQ